MRIFALNLIMKYLNLLGVMRTEPDRGTDDRANFLMELLWSWFCFWVYINLNFYQCFLFPLSTLLLFHNGRGGIRFRATTLPTHPSPMAILSLPPTLLVGVGERGRCVRGLCVFLASPFLHYLTLLLRDSTLYQDQ